MASELTLEQKTWHQLECAANSAGGIEVAMVSLPIAQVKALVEGRNTRPAPAATDTGLETVGYGNPDALKIVAKGIAFASIAGKYTTGLTEPVCLRSQAEELLAAMRAENATLKAGIKRLSDEQELLAETTDGDMISVVRLAARLAEAEADNAAKDARIKELESEADIADETIRDQINGSIADILALESKLAAAHKALEPFADIAEWDIGDSEDDDDIYRPMDGRYAVAKLIRVGDLRKARAVLGGTP